MNSYIVMPEGENWLETEATSHDMAYWSICCWYHPNKKIAIMDWATKETKIYTRKLDNAGNLHKIIEIEKIRGTTPNFFIKSFQFYKTN